MKIKIVRKGEYDWVSDMSEYIGRVYSVTGIFIDEDSGLTGYFLDGRACDGASCWTWYSDAVEIVEE